ncbi:MAG TPA: fibronectin type III domain-containing protein [Pirellulales bacterium]|jgi:subtilase family serine protease
MFLQYFGVKGAKLRRRRDDRGPCADRRLRVESLESRQLLTASGFQTDHLNVPAASSGVTGYTPTQIRAAYGINAVSFGSTAADGSGQTIAIIDAYNDPNIRSDLAAFDSAMGIAAPKNFTIVNQNGGSSLPGTDPSQGWEGETALDVEWAHAIAPGANIVLVEASSASDSDLFAAVNYARNLAGVSVISMSWGSDDSLSNASNDQALSSKYLVTPTGHQGITFVASSGDDGKSNFPAESPNVLAVGGTDLYLTSSGAITNETAWTPTTSGGQIWSGGGGVSQEFSGRKSPDVAYNAGVGMAVYDTFGPDHGWVSIGGTSAGAPQWAALVAIADQGRALNGQSTLNGATQTLPAIYAAASADFHDITTGSTQFQSTAVGYDLATGRGSPVANLLVPYLVSYGVNGTSGTGTITGTGTTGGGTTATAPATPANFSATAVSTTQVNLSWTASSGATGYNVYELENGLSVLIGSVGASATSATITNLTAGTAYSFAIAATNSTGSAETGWAKVTTLSPVTTPLSAPHSVQVAATSSTTATVSWSASAGATGYRVYEWNGSQAVQVGNVGAGTTSLAVSGLTPNSTQYFYVAAYNATTTAATGWASVVMPKAAALAAPTNVVATATSATAGTISWSASAGATAYQIYYWNGAQSVYLGQVSASTTSVTISGLNTGSTTYFAVVAVNSTSSAASGWAALTTPSTLASRANSLTLAQYAAAIGPLGRLR